MRKRDFSWLWAARIFYIGMLMLFAYFWGYWAALGEYEEIVDDMPAIVFLVSIWAWTEHHYRKRKVEEEVSSDA